jgi:hypothetical protein
MNFVYLKPEMKTKKAGMFINLDKLFCVVDNDEYLSCHGEDGQKSFNLTGQHAQQLREILHNIAAN